MKNMAGNSRSRHSEVAAANRQNNDFGSLMNYFWNYTDMPESFTEDLEPKIQVTENKDAINISAELPGIDENDLDLQISANGYLTICGEKKNSNSSSSKDAYFSEISYGMFKRTIPLPWDLAFDNADATYKNGVLNVLIPKTQVEKQKFKKIAIKTTDKN